MNTYNFARSQARAQGVKILDKKNLQGYRVFEDIECMYTVDLMYYDRFTGWEVYDFAQFDTIAEARESAREHIKRR